MDIVQCPHCGREFWDALVFAGGPCPRCRREVQEWPLPKVLPPPDPDDDE